MDTIFVVTDVEVDGPIPGKNSMLSFASVAVDVNGAQIDFYEAALLPLEGAFTDPLTMSWFRSQPEVYEAATNNAKPADEVMSQYVKWVKSLPGDPIFVAHPIAFDGPWVDFYLQNFVNIRLMKGPWIGERLFYAGGLCLRSFASGKLGWPLTQCDTDHYSSDWLGNNAHTHKAIDDARGYASLLAYLKSI